MRKTTRVVSNTEGKPLTVNLTEDQAKIASSILMGYVFELMNRLNKNEDIKNLKGEDKLDISKLSEEERVMFVTCGEVEKIIDVLSRDVKDK